ncbi:NlpC/P60 family protein [Streptomyces sp. NPDC088554]|uniref:NlpC/P60 family protein n=1 Tax=Streptomyces sp. NPDC088554 TaxID=3365865 RepID=UPI00382DB4BF
MPGRVLRSSCTAAALAAVTVLAGVPFAPYATAEPVPVTTAEPVPVPVPAAEPVPVAEPTPVPTSDNTSASGPADTSVSALLTRLQRLYRETEEATEAYNATEVSLQRRLAETKRLTADLARARNALSLSRGAAGQLAREQYRGESELSGYLRLLLAPDPRRALDEGYLLERAARARLDTMRKLAGGEKRAAALATASHDALAEQEALAARRKEQRDTVTAGLQEVEKLLASLSSDQIAALTALEQAHADKAQERLVASGALGEPATSILKAPSPAGSAALEYAAEQIGKPYEWGAEGPGAFDCSGLTSRAWARAGVTIPRTSQEQWNELPRVSLRELRPGDLVVYFPKATHVAIYLGEGRVIQAPRPGARVKVSPLAANPPLGAVRPDPRAAALAPGAYEPPALPKGATDGSDLGYGGTRR